MRDVEDRCAGGLRKIGGVSPVVPKSIAPTLMASSNGGPDGNSVQSTPKPSGSSFFSRLPLALSSTSVPYF